MDAALVSSRISDINIGYRLADYAPESGTQGVYGPFIGGTSKAP